MKADVLATSQPFMFGMITAGSLSWLNFKASKDVKLIQTGVGNHNISQTIILSMAYLVILLCGPFQNGENFISQPSRRTVALFPVDTVTCFFAA